MLIASALTDEAQFTTILLREREYLRYFFIIKKKGKPSITQVRKTKLASQRREDLPIRPNAHTAQTQCTT